MELDRTDRKILSILQEDGRIANVDLAERIGLSPTSIGERLTLAFGHVGMVIGGRAPQALWQPLARWLSACSPT